MSGPFRFGKKSAGQLATLHPDLKLVCVELIQVYDFSILEGARTIEQQITNIRNGASKTIDSRHIPRDAAGNYDPNGLAIAADLLPYTEGVNPWPLDSDKPVVREKKKARFYFMQGAIYHIAHAAGVRVRQGVDWDMDADFFDQTFDDLPHVELDLALPPLRLPANLLAAANEALRSRRLPAYNNPA